MALLCHKDELILRKWFYLTYNMYFFFYSYEMAPFTSNEWAMEDKCKGGISVNYSELCESMQHYAKKKKKSVDWA